MEESSRRFARRIFAAHMALLGVVLALVSLASAEIYKSTRDQAKLEAKIHQQLLADQTCRGIETYYASIINDLGWIQPRPDRDADDPTPIETQFLNRGAKPLAARLIAEQLGDRVSALFTYDKKTGAVTTLLPEGSTLNGKQLSPEMHGFLREVAGKRVSRFMKLNGEGVSLVAAPFGANIRRLLVAVVPGKQIESKFLPLLNEQNNASATLLDSRLEVITSSNKALLGLNFKEFDDDDVRSMALDYEVHPKTVTRLFDKPVLIRGVNLGPRMITMAPVEVAGDQWALFFAYPVADIDATINSLFRRAVLWAGFVALSITAILVSTAIQMVRYRSRLERFQHKVLTRELAQARRIQLNWLPDKTAAGPAVDIAAVNHPASHISGDFYNWFELPDGRQVITIGDVTGHGMAAAFLMATTQLLVRNTVARLPDPGEALAEVNRQLCTQVFHGQFVTMMIMVLDFEHGHLDVASAGHPQPLISDDTGFRVLDVEAQLVLGIEPAIVYPTQRFDLPPRSSLLLYTDGVVDAQSSTGERYTTEMLQQALYGRFGTAQQIVDRVVSAVNEFRAGRELEDDVTLVAIQLQATTPHTAAGGEGRRSVAANVDS